MVELTQRVALSALEAGSSWSLPVGLSLAALGVGALLLMQHQRRKTSRWLRELHELTGQADPGPAQSKHEAERIWSAFLEYMELVRRTQVDASSSQVRMNLLRNESERLQAIFQAIPIGILVLRSGSRILYTNDLARDLLVVPVDGESVLDDAQGPPRILAAVRSVLGGDLAGGVRTERVVLERPEEDPRTYLVKLLSRSSARARLREEDVQIVTFEDVTSEESTQRMKSEFVYGVSHELKTPLTSIQASLEMLVEEENLDPEDRKRLLDLSYSESIRLGRMVREMLDLARVEAGVTEVRRERVVVRDLMGELRDVHAPLAARKSIDMRWEISEFIPTVIGDRDLLLQAFVNLIGNAIKYSREGGRVAVEASVQGEELKICVRDDGIGIAQEDLGRIFDRFYRASSARKTSIPGTGLGLPLARFIVETHGGRIDVESEEGKGSTFTVFLPREEAGSDELETSSLQSMDSLTGG